MKHANIKIWEMDKGRITSIKIEDNVFPLRDPFNYDPCSECTDQINNPIEVASAFVKLFDLKHSQKDDSFRKFGSEEHKAPTDVIEDIGTIEINKANLKLIYNTFKDREFTSNDLYNATRGKITPFGMIRVATYLGYLNRNGFVETRPYGRDNKNTTYRFKVPFDKWDFEEKTNVRSSKSITQTGLNKTTSSYMEKQEHNAENGFLAQRSSNLPPDLICKTKNGLYITDSKLRKLYYALKSVSKFSVVDAHKILKSVPGYSEPVIRAYMSYLVDRGYAACECKAPNNCKIYTFLVSASSWNFEKQRRLVCKSECCAQNNQFGPDVIIKPPYVKVDFDSEEVKNRRMLEMQTARGEA